MFTKIKVCNRSNSCWTKEVGCMTEHAANMNKKSFTLKTNDTLRKTSSFNFLPTCQIVSDVRYHSIQKYSLNTVYHMKYSLYMQSSISSLFTSSLFTVSVHIRMCINITYISIALQTQQLKCIIQDKNTEDIYMWSVWQQHCTMSSWFVYISAPHTVVISQFKRTYQNFSHQANGTRCATTQTAHETGSHDWVYTSGTEITLYVCCKRFRQ